MRQKVKNVFKHKFLFFMFLLLMFESIILGSVIAAEQMGKTAMKSALFLRKLYLKEALKVSIPFGIFIEVIVFLIFLLYELKKTK